MPVVYRSRPVVKLRFIADPGRGLVNASVNIEDQLHKIFHFGGIRL